MKATQIILPPAQPPPTRRPPVPRPRRVLTEIPPRVRVFLPCVKIAACEFVLAAVAAADGCDMDDIRCGTHRMRSARLFACRMAFAWLCRNVVTPQPSFPEIAASLTPGKSHTGAFNAVRRFHSSPRAIELARIAAGTLGKREAFERALQESTHEPR